MDPETIRKTRTRAQLTQGELGRILGVGQGLVSQWELGGRTPTAFQEAALWRIKHRLDKADRDYNLRAALLGIGSITAVAFLSWLEGKESPPTD